MFTTAKLAMLASIAYLTNAGQDFNPNKGTNRSRTIEKKGIQLLLSSSQETELKSYLFIEHEDAVHLKNVVQVVRATYGPLRIGLDDNYSAVECTRGIRRELNDGTLDLGIFGFSDYCGNPAPHQRN